MPELSPEAESIQQTTKATAMGTSVDKEYQGKITLAQQELSLLKEKNSTLDITSTIYQQHTAEVEKQEKLLKSIEAEYKKLKDFTDKCISSKDMWMRRVIVVATFYQIKNHSNKEIFYISKKLFKDEHHLIHKAIGWMLRESGKRCSELDLISFIRENKEKMHRVTYSYAMERVRRSINIGSH